MACLDQLQDDVAEILAIMQLGNQCCDDIDVTDGDQYTDRVTDGEGDVPQNIIDAGYADDAADWDGFDDYKCMISHVIVDQIPARLLEFAPIVNSYGAVAGGAAAVAAILAVVFGTGGLALVFGIVAGVGAVSLLYESLLEGDLLVTLAAKVVTNEEALICAVYFSDGDEGALVALNDAIDENFTTIEAIILKNMNLGPTLKLLYSGRYDQQDIAEILDDAGYDVGDFNCDCDIQLGEYSVTVPFLADKEGWANSGATWINQGDPDPGAVYFDAVNGYMEASMQLVRNLASCPPGTNKLTINRIIFHHKRTNSTAGNMRLSLKHTSVDSFEFFYDAGSDHPTWLVANIVFSPGFDLDLTGIAAKFQGSGTANYQWLDTVTFEFDAEIV